jgi:hypothetical protein
MFCDLQSRRLFRCASPRGSASRPEPSSSTTSWGKARRSSAGGPANPPRAYKRSPIQAPLSSLPRRGSCSAAYSICATSSSKR